MQNEVTKCDGVLIFEQDGKCFFCLDWSTVISIQGQGRGLAVIAPALTRCVGTHFNGVSAVNGNKLIFLQNGTVFDVNIDVSVIRLVPIVLAAVFYTNLNSSLFTGDRRSAGNSSTAVKQLITVRELTLKNFARPIATRIVVSAANTVKQIDLGVFLKIDRGNLDNAIAYPYKSFCRRIGISKHRMLNGVALGITQNVVAVVYCFIFEINVFIVGRCCGNGIGVHSDIGVIINDVTRQINQAALFECHLIQGVNRNTARCLTAVVVGNCRYLCGTVGYIQIVDGNNAPLFSARNIDGYGNVIAIRNFKTSVSNAVKVTVFVIGVAYVYVQDGRLFDVFFIKYNRAVKAVAGAV